MNLKFFVNGDAQKAIDFNVERILNGGFAGRNQDQVRKHIEELAALGVPAPKETPVFYPLLPDKLTTGEEVEVIGSGNSGEVEFVILYSQEGLFVGLGSDHTDRELEKTSIIKSKQAYPNVIAPTVWRYEDVISHWDEIEMRAWLGENKETLYQEGRLALLMRPEELMERAQALVDGGMTGTVLYSGTLATLEELRFSEYFHIELFDKVRNERISHVYRIKQLNWFKGEI
ncbi:MAG: DUF2848 family protein [Desulfitobacteriaceae bacterium]